MTDRPIQRFLDFSNVRPLFQKRPLSAPYNVSEPLPEAPDVKTPAVSLTADGKPKKLYPYQAKGANWLYSRARALLADEMGLGKTVQVFRALPKNTPSVIVAPASLRLVWRDECLDWRPDLSPIVCRSGEFIVPAPREVSIVSYESLPTPQKGARNWLVPDARLNRATLVFDEGQYLKNYRAQRTQKAKLLAAQCSRVWILTGTPMLGTPFDLWGVLCAAGLEKQVFGPGNAWNTFMRLFGGHRNRWGGTDFDKDPPGAEEIRQRLGRVALRRLKKDVLPELPSKSYQTIAVDPPDDLRAKLDFVGANWTNQDDLPPFELLSEVRSELARARIPNLIETVERYESEKVPLVVFSAHRDPIQALSGREGWGLITGDTAPELRRNLVDLFQTGLLSGLALTIQAGGVGLTLTRAAHVLFVDLAYTPAENSQAEDRLVRIGQKAEGVLVMRMVADHPVDRRILEILDQKQRLIAATTGGALG